MAKITISFTCSFTHSISLSLSLLPHSLIRSFTHSFMITHSLTHTLTQLPPSIPSLSFFPLSSLLSQSLLFSSFWQFLYHLYFNNFSHSLLLSPSPSLNTLSLKYSLFPSLLLSLTSIGLHMYCSCEVSSYVSLHLLYSSWRAVELELVAHTKLSL